jgi:hypothetical protein
VHARDVGRDVTSHDGYPAADELVPEAALGVEPPCHPREVLSTVELQGPSACGVLLARVRAPPTAVVSLSKAAKYRARSGAGAM